MAVDIARVFAELGLSVLERGWLSSNSVVFPGTGETPATVVDTGYVAHSEQTVALIAEALGGEPLGRILNTHLHSDHCGGNAALQARWGCEVWVPDPSFEAAENWDAGRLTFEATDQRCDRFTVAGRLRVGERVRLGRFEWEVLAGPGHDPEAVLLFQPAGRVMITADALWERRVAINFPELAGRTGFRVAMGTLEAIEERDVAVCIPGHGAPFDNVATAIARSRERLLRFEAEPAAHLAYAERALTMFHMLERRSLPQSALISWLERAPVFSASLAQFGFVASERAPNVVGQLVRDGLLRVDAEGVVHVAE